MERSAAWPKASRANQIAFSPPSTRNQPSNDFIFLKFTIKGCQSLSADCRDCATASEEHISQTGCYSVDASDFGFEGGEGDGRVDVAQHFEVDWDELIEVKHIVSGVVEGLLGCVGNREIFLRFGVSIWAVVEGCIVALRAVFSVFCPSGRVHMEFQVNHHIYGEHHGWGFIIFAMNPLDLIVSGVICTLFIPRVSCLHLDIFVIGISIAK